MESCTIGMHVEDAWAGVRSGLLDARAGTFLLEHFLGLIDQIQPGSLPRMSVALGNDWLRLDELRRRNLQEQLDPAGARDVLAELLTSLESTRPGCLRSIYLELQFVPDPACPGSTILQRLSVADS